MRNKQRWQSSTRAGGGHRLAAWAVFVLAFVCMPLPTMESASASCCVCRSNSGPCTGFCADGVSSGACQTLCQAAGCVDLVYHSVDVCAGGCDVASPLPTATPTNTVNTATSTPSGTVGSSVTSTATRTPSGTGTPTTTSSPTSTPRFCCQNVQFCEQKQACAPGEQIFDGGNCVRGPDRPVVVPPLPTLSLCVFFTPSASPTATPTITPTPTTSGTPTTTPSITLTPTNTATNTSTPTPTPRSTDTPPWTPTPQICCQSGALCDDTKGQVFTDGRTPAIVCLPGGANGNTALQPMPYAKCEPNVGCILFTPTSTFTASFTVTSTRTNTPTPTPTLSVPTAVIDPYKCYRIKEGNERFDSHDITLVEQFGNRSSRVLKPFLACNPSIIGSGKANPTHTPGRHGGQVNPDAHLVCFKVKDREELTTPATGELRVKFYNETNPDFTTIKAEYVKGDLICMPAALIPTPRPTPIVCSPGGDGNPPAKICPTRPPMTPAYKCFENVCITPTPAPRP